MQNAICLITGANSGIGYVTALELAKQGATVVMVARNRSKGEAAQATIKARSGNAAVELLQADFASLQSVRALADEFRLRYQRLDVLVNNVGVYLDRRLKSDDGYEMSFAVNHLAPFLLTNLLLDLLKAGAPARIINVSSAAHLMGQINFDDLHGVRSFNGWWAYCQSKLANVLFTYELAARLNGTGVTANCLHPGVVATNFNSGNTGFMSTVLKLTRPFMLSPEQGAATSIYLASSPAVVGVTGKYFDKKTAVPSSRASYDPVNRRRLWEVSEQLVGLGVAEAAAR